MAGPLSFPIHLTDTPLDTPAAPPTLSEHTEAILASPGWSEEQVRQLRAEKAA